MSVRVFHEDGRPLCAPNMSLMATVLLIVVLAVLSVPWPKTIHVMKFDIYDPLIVGRKVPSGLPLNVNKVSVSREGNVVWNGVPIDLLTLRHYLSLTKTFAIEPELRIEPDPAAKYGQVATVLAVIKQSEATKVRFVGNRTFASFPK